MALTRKLLSALGIDADKVDEIINAHSDTVDGLKDELKKAQEKADSYKADAEKLAEVQKELDSLKEAGDKDPFKVKYDALKEEFEAFKNEQTVKATKEAKEKAFKALLKSAGINEKRIDAVARVSDLESIELDENGNIKDADKLAESVKSEWSDFIVTEQSTGAKTPTPSGMTTGTKKTKEEIMQIKDAGERQQAMLENREAFGI